MECASPLRRQGKPGEETSRVKREVGIFSMLESVRKAHRRLRGIEKWVIERKSVRTMI